ncbi:phosphatase PAP2 family protein [Anaerolentibacter hominis]|uniref:phosphatase PAP2 family protein n=1 Tax=Anaerolentibacter hominis TaxID=3079009 RepID=UPI0031B8AFC0
MQPIQVFDEFILHLIQSLSTPALDRIMIFLTHLADRGFLWVLLAFCLLASKKYRQTGSLICLSLLFSALLGDHILKPLFARTRPFAACPSIHLLIQPPGSFSFPSGHTMTSFAAAASLFSLNRKAGMAAGILAAAIGFSRMYVGVHYFTDVLAGAAAGILTALLLTRLLVRPDKNAVPRG